MDEALHLLRTKQISFDEFARRTAKDWDKLARYVYYPWRRKLPPSVTQEDVRQEMLACAWQRVMAYDPSKAKSQTLTGYVVFCAISKAKRFIHRERESYRLLPDSPERRPYYLSEMAVDELTQERLAGDDDGSGATASVQWADFGVRYRRALRRALGSELYALVAFKQAAGDLHLAGCMLFDERSADPRLMRRQAGWSRPGQASKYIQRVVVGAMS